MVVIWDTMCSRRLLKLRDPSLLALSVKSIEGIFEIICTSSGSGAGVAAAEGLDNDNLSATPRAAVEAEADLPGEENTCNGMGERSERTLLVTLLAVLLGPVLWLLLSKLPRRSLRGDK